MNTYGVKRKQEEEKEDEAKWLCTFNDLMTLLLTFFVLLFSMSSLDFGKMKAFQTSLQSALGILESGEMTEVAIIEKLQHQAVGEGPKAEAGEEETEAFVNAMSAESGVGVTVTEKTVTIVLEDTILYESGEALINPEAYTILDKIAVWMNKVPFPVRIEGHTDNIPIKTDRYPSNWELSTARAVNVLKYFVAAGGIAPARCSAAGYGASRPLQSNETPEGMRKNRRVEFILLKEGKK
jgi:chemotaxis protein MotB